jgi:hypothetical protein
MKIYNKYDMEDFRNLEFSFKKGAAPTPPPTVAPTAPVEEASVEIEDDENKRLRTGKSSLKMPLATATDTGLKV